MNNNDLSTALTDVADYFPPLGKRLAESPKLLELWHRRLRPFDLDAVQAAIEYYATHRNVAPTLDDLLETLERLRDEEVARRPVGNTASRSVVQVEPVEVLESLALGAQDEHDIAWAALHVEMVTKGLAKPTSQARRAMGKRYREFAGQCPRLGALAQAAGFQCDKEADVISEQEVPF